MRCNTGIQKLVPVIVKYIWIRGLCERLGKGLEIDVGAILYRVC